MKKLFIILILIILILIVLALTLTACGKQGRKEATMELQDKKALMIIAFEDFQDHEYGKTREILEKQEVEIAVASSSLGEATGKFGAKVKVDFLLKEAKVKDFDVIIFIGGSGAVVYQEDPEAHRIVKEAIIENKVLAAICIAPAILARAGVLQGKKATIWSSPVDKESIDLLEQEGAIFVDEPVVQDELIITANGPQATEEFGQRILKVMSNR